MRSEIREANEAAVGATELIAVLWRGLLADYGALARSLSVIERELFCIRQANIAKRRQPHRQTIWLA